MEIVSQLGMCSQERKEVGFQFKVEGTKYTAAGSFIPGATSSGSIVAGSLNGSFYTAPNLKCKWCGRSHLYQCCFCKNFICYDGKEHRGMVCPKCGKTSDVAEQPQSGAIVSSGVSAVNPDIVLAIDTSGSMWGSRLSEVKSGAINNFVRKFQGKCRMAVVQFGDRHEVTLGLTSDMNAVERTINNLSADGGTPSPFPLVLNDYRLNDFRSSSNPRYVVVFTDGEWAGYESTHVADANTLKQKGIKIIAIGCAGAKTSFLRAIASPGADITTTDGSISGGFATAANNIFGQG